MPKHPDGTPGKKPPAPSVSKQPMTLLLRTTCAQARIEGLNPDIWSCRIGVDVRL
jgi:hypothetical protein